MFVMEIPVFISRLSSQWGATPFCLFYVAEQIFQCTKVERSSDCTTTRFIFSVASRFQFAEQFRVAALVAQTLNFHMRTDLRREF